MHTESVVRRVARLRHIYTGETPSELHPAACAAVQRLTRPQRATLKDVLDASEGSETSLSVPPVDSIIRSTVLPDASTRRQGELEAAVLLAIGRGDRYRIPDSSSRRHELLRMVRPHRGGLTLHISRRTVATLAVELLPREQDGQLVGLPGLRTKVHRRHVQLYLADAPDVRVFLADIAPGHFAAALAFASAVGSFSAELKAMPRPVSELEQAAIGRGSAFPTGTLASALLRRLGLLRDADSISIEPIGSACLRLCWTGGPTPAFVTAMLTHAVTGLPDSRMSTTSTLDGTITIHCGELGGVIALRHNTNPLDEQLTTLGWTAFATELRARQIAEIRGIYRHKELPA